MQLHKTLYILGILTALTTVGCGQATSTDDNRPILLTGIKPQAQLLSELAGDSYRIVTLLDNSANPESFELTPIQLREATTAKAFFAIGTLPFEQQVIEIMPSSMPIVKAVDNVELIYGTHGDEHGVDPHLWASPRNLKLMAASMATQLSNLLPDSAQIYSDRLATLNAKLDSIDTLIRTSLTSSHQAFGVWHPSLSYYARDYGLRQHALGAEHKDTGTQHLREAIDNIRTDSVKVIFYENEGELARVLTVCEGSGAHAVELNLLGEDWLNQLTTIAYEIARP